jgi:hypothetical protein
VNPHGNYDINFGDLANGSFTVRVAIFATSEGM